MDFIAGDKPVPASAGNSTAAIGFDVGWGAARTANHVAHIWSPRCVGRRAEAVYACCKEPAWFQTLSPGLNQERHGVTDSCEL